MLSFEIAVFFLTLTISTMSKPFTSKCYLYLYLCLLVLDGRIQFWRIPGKMTNTYYWMIRMAWNSPLNRGTVYAIISKNQDHQNQTYASTMHWSPWQFDFSSSKYVIFLFTALRFLFLFLFFPTHQIFQIAIIISNFQYQFYNIQIFL